MVRPVSQPCFWFESKEPFLKDGQVVIRLKPNTRHLDIVVESFNLYLMQCAPTKMEIMGAVSTAPLSEAPARASSVPWRWKFSLSITQEARDSLTSCNAFHLQLSYPGGSYLKSHHSISLLKGVPRGKRYVRCRDTETFPFCAYSAPQPTVSYIVNVPTTPQLIFSS